MHAGEGFLLVYRVRSPKSFEAISELHEHILPVKRHIANSARIQSPLIMVVGNHVDRKTEWQVSMDDG